MNEAGKGPGKVGQAEARAYGRALLAYGLFLAALLAAAYFICGAVWDDVTDGVMEFILVVLGGGFLLVAGLDFLYGMFRGPAGTGGGK
jgi:hypothetical protein